MYFSKCSNSRNAATPLFFHKCATFTEIYPNFSERCVIMAKKGTIAGITVLLISCVLVSTHCLPRCNNALFWNQCFSVLILESTCPFYSIAPRFLTKLLLVLFFLPISLFSQICHQFFQPTIFRPQIFHTQIFHLKFSAPNCPPFSLVAVLVMSPVEVVGGDGRH